MGNAILLVDDEPDWGRIVATFLKLAGYKVATAADAAQAVRHADQGSFGVIILDVNLAGEDATELLRSLRTRQPQAKVVLYTGLEQAEARVQGLLGQGAEHYLRKGNLKDLVGYLRSLSGTFGFSERKPSALAGAWQIA